MARDPFAPVTQPNIPPWVLPIGIVLGVLFIATAIATVLVVSRRPPVQPVIAAPALTPPPPPAAANKDSVAAAGPASAPDTAKPDEGKDADHPRHHRARAGAGHDKVASRGAGAPAPAPEVKKKKPAMNQKEIDSLLGL